MRRKRDPEVLERGFSTGFPINIDYRLERLSQWVIPDGSWLDCGCGNGNFAAALLRAGAKQVVGIEPDRKRFEEAQVINGGTGVQFLCGSAEELPFADETFDGVLLNEVLEHVTNEAATLREICRILRPGGSLALMSPNRWFPFETHGMHIGRRTLKYPVPFLPWIPRIVSLNVMLARNYWPGELAALVEASGLEIVTRSWIFPVLEQRGEKLLPKPLIRLYRLALPNLHRLPLVKRFGVSNLIIARKPAHSPVR